MKKMKPVACLCCLLLAIAARGYGQSNHHSKEQKQQIMTQQILIDKFTVPQPAIDTFMERVRYNRSFIRQLPGFVRDAAYAHTDEKGNLTFVTVAVWESETAIQEARAAVQAEYKRLGFNMQQMLEQLNITIDRGIYREVEEQ